MSNRILLHLMHQCSGPYYPYGSYGTVGMYGSFGMSGAMPPYGAGGAYH
jgi:hypothetical protein